MIAKRIRRQGGGFKRLAAYVVAEKNGGLGDPMDWKLGEYILDHAHAGEKVAWAHATNCVNEDLGWAVREILATQGQNKRATADLSYHLVVSFPDGERPTREQMEDIERTLCETIGFGEHQRIAAVHQDTKHWHMHIAINRVHPTSLRAIEPYYDQYRLQEALAELEIKHDLTRGNHTTRPVEKRTMNEKAKAMEAHSGRISFQRWLTGNAAVSLTAAAATARTWEDLHQVAAEFGVQIKPRGAGLIIANATDSRARVKASAVDRRLSFNVLTARLGPYQAPDPDRTGKEPAMSYNSVGLIGPGADSLWTKYQAERQSATDAREAAMRVLRDQQIAYARDLSAWYRQRYANARAAHLNRGDRISTMRILEHEYNRDQAARKEQEKEQRDLVKADHQVPTWQTFLAREAGRGDGVAMQTLKRSVGRQIQTGIVSNERELGR